MNKYVKKYEVIAIKTKENMPNWGITHIKTVDLANGGGWEFPLWEVIQEIEECTAEFFVVDRNQNRILLEVSDRNGRKYIKTEADDSKPNNLLYLPQFKPNPNH